MNIHFNLINRVFIQKLNDIVLRLSISKSGFYFSLILKNTSFQIQNTFQAQ